MSYKEVVSAMTEFANVTNANHITYTPLGDGVYGLNSNSYAFTFVESLGLGRPTPLLGVPGWKHGRPSRSLIYPIEP